jgi:hypothetical protein
VRRTVILTLIVLVTAVAACTNPAPPARSAQSTTRITGTLVEKLDGPPYSYLRIKTDKGDVWAAVPITSIDANKPVTVVTGVPLKRFESKPLGKTFEVVTFGTLQR